MRDAILLFSWAPLYLAFGGDLSYVCPSLVLVYALLRLVEMGRLYAEISHDSVMNDYDFDRFIAKLLDKKRKLWIIARSRELFAMRGRHES